MKIEFIPVDKETELLVSPPEPASKVLAEWYKNTPRFYGGEPQIENGQIKNNSVKACYPFYDAISAGYIQKTWCDIHLSFEENSVRYNFSSGPEIISARDSTHIKVSENYWPVELIWQIRWSIKTPPGWGYIMVPPLNRLDLPFESLSGIVDSDKFNYAYPGSYPFYVKKSFNNFVIPEGTPMYQIIPFKREDWERKILPLNEEKIKKTLFQINKNFIGGYKKYFHTKKVYR